MDDTFVIVHTNMADHPLGQLGRVFSSINFTIEIEKESKLAFFDVEVHCNPDDSLKTSVFRKPTHTSRLLHYNSCRGVGAAGMTGFLSQTNIQAFNDILDAAILSVPVCGEDVEVTERLTDLGSDIHASAGCEPEVNRRLGQAWGVMDSLDHGVWHCQYQGWEEESASLQVLDASSLALWM